MDDIWKDVYKKLARGNAILFGKDSACLLALAAGLDGLSRRAVVLWALTCVRKPVAALEEYFPGDGRFGQTLALARLWAEGRLKMPEARRAILSVHAAARLTEDGAAKALCHAVGQACSAVHSRRHAMGLPVYELTAMVRKYPDGWESVVAGRIEGYLAAARSAEEEARRCEEWAPFLK